MALKLKAFDAAPYFATTDSQLRLLEDAFEKGEAGYVAAALGTIARARGMTQLAVELGVSRTSLYASLNENGNPSLDTALRVLRLLGIALRAEAAPPPPAHEYA